MFDNLISSWQELYYDEIVGNLKNLYNNPANLIVSILDLIIVVFLIYKAVKLLRKTRAWQLLKGIAVLIIINLISGWLKLTILHYILSSVMTYGIFVLIVVFQPELRRGLEQLRSW